MNLHFTTDQFFDLFASYNGAIWPSQIIAYGLGILALGALRLRHPYRERLIFSILALMWTWNALAYHLVFFTRINAAAYGFAGLFLIQAALFLARAAVPGAIRIETGTGWKDIAAMGLTAYAMLVYEVLGILASHGLLEGPLFGVAPCPTTIFTVAMLILGSGRGLWGLAVIPLLWCVIGTTAAVLLAVPEDGGLTVAGLLLAISLFFPDARTGAHTGRGDMR